MKLFQIILSALIYQASYQAAVKERIFFGKEADEEQFPYQVEYMILFTDRYNTVGRPCGGSLISAKHVLTAAHCLEIAESEFWPIAAATAFGSIHSKKKELSNALRNFQTQREQFDENIQVCRDCWTSHWLYTHYDFKNYDIAIIHLPQEVQFSNTIRPVQLPSSWDKPSALIGMTAVVTGWGHTEHDSSSNTLLFANFRITDNSWQCINDPRILPGIDICIERNDNYLYRVPTTCNGDSGGPLVVDNKQVGIVSRGKYSEEKCEFNEYHVYTRVSSCLPWISETTGLKFE